MWGPIFEIGDAGSFGWGGAFHAHRGLLQGLAEDQPSAFGGLRRRRFPKVHSRDQACEGGSGGVGGSAGAFPAGPSGRGGVPSQRECTHWSSALGVMLPRFTCVVAGIGTSFLPMACSPVCSSRLFIFKFFSFIFLSETLLMRWKGPLFPSRASVPCSSAPAVKFIFQGVFFCFKLGLDGQPGVGVSVSFAQSEAERRRPPRPQQPGLQGVRLRSRSLWPRKAGPVLGVQIPVRAPRQVCG